jgi:hypothetical protein
MLVEELLGSPKHMGMAPPEVDPFRQPDALQEAQLLEARVDALSSTVGLLFELRTAMYLMEGNTALLIARGVREFKWSAEARLTGKTAWNIVGSEPLIANELFIFEIDFLPVSQMRLVAQSAEFYTGNVDGLHDQLSDYVEDDDVTVRANLASWRSSFMPLQVTFLNMTI